MNPYKEEEPREENRCGECDRRCGTLTLCTDCEPVPTDFDDDDA
jgi:hypothetical protein